MDFIIRKATYEDIPAIMQVMEEVQKVIEHPEWFCSDSREYMMEHIENHGFTIVAEAESEPKSAPVSNTTGCPLAGFFLIKYPGLTEENLGWLLDFNEGKLRKTVHMDMAAVHPGYQGNCLQNRMLKKAEEILSESTAFSYLMATVHPDNQYSLNNMLKNGYQIVKTTELYGGLPRHVLLKTL